MTRLTKAWAQVLAVMLMMSKTESCTKMIPSFPLTRCTQEEALKDYVELCGTSFVGLISKKAWQSRSELDDKYVYDYVVGKSNIGNKSSNFYHWQSRVACDSLNSPSPIRSWYDYKLRRSIESSIYYKESHKSALTMRGYIASQFRPSAAKALYEVFNAKNIYDPCGGWGDRLSAALASDCNLYYCRDVNPMVFSGYALQQQELNSSVVSSFEYKGSEVDCPKENAFDFVFTSPPYYKIEKYQGDLQSHALYKKFDAWMESFLYPMITNAWQALTDGGYLLLNVSDCYANHTYNKICMPLINYALAELPNCHLNGIMGYEITSRQKGGVNAEPILVFSNKDTPLDQLLPEEPQMDLLDEL